MQELTVPWEKQIDKAHERKRNKYQELVEECRDRGWRTFYEPIEVGCRGKRAVQSTSEAAEKATSFQTLTGATGRSETTRHLTLLWGCESVITLEEKNLEGYNHKLLSFEKVEHKSAEVMSMNLRSQSTCKAKKMQTHDSLILVGLLFFCSLSLSHSKECRPDISTDIRFIGTRIATLYSTDPVHCQKLCTQHPQCGYFTYFREDSAATARRYKCLIKSGSPDGIEFKDGVSSGYSLKLCNQEKSHCLSKVYQNLEFQGEGYTSLLTATTEECQRVCARDRFCQFFTFVSKDFTEEAERYKCHLKYRWSVPRISQVTSQANTVSGFSNRINLFQNFIKECESTFFTDTKIKGKRFMSMFAASPEHCQALCSAHPCCTLFSYVSATFACRMHDNSDELITQTEVGVKSGLPVHECLMNDSWVTKQHDGIAFGNPAMSSIEKDNATECQQACNTDRNCQFYTFSTSQSKGGSVSKTCNLMRSITMPVPKKIQAKNNVVSGFSVTCI